MPLLKRELTPYDCYNWRRKKNKNPITNYKIDTSSPIYKEIERICSKIKSPKINEEEEIKKIKNKPGVLKRPLTKEDCEKWLKNKNKNPITNYTIKENSIIYNEIRKQCSDLVKKQILPNIDKKSKEKKIITDKVSKEESIVKEKEEEIIEEKKKSIETIVEKKEQELIENENETLNKELYYPELNDKDFRNKLSNIEEFYIHKIKKFKNIRNKEEYKKQSEKICGKFEKAYYQHFMGHYLSSRTPYRSLLMYHAVGVGKTCSAITIAETFLIPHNIYDEPKIWVIMPTALEEGFKEQVFNIMNIDNLELLENQCTGNIYSRLLHINKKSEMNKVNNKLKKLINSRYRIFTYDSFSKFIESEYINKNKIVNDKVIIIDEAHNIRSSDNTDKRIYLSLLNILPSGNNNRLVLLTATPMYNEPSDIFDLLYLLLLNDKRDDILKIPYPKIFNENNEINKNVLDIIKKLANNYISYLRGKNPFSFALKLTPKDSNIPILEKEIPYDINNNEIPENDKKWVNKIKVGGIVLSELGEKQKEHIKTLKNLNEDNIFNTQPMNIVYGINKDNDFYNIFTKVSDKDPINVRYNKTYEDALMPDEEHLGKYSGKLLKIANIIRNSKGIVVIYSRFIWSGILPMAICLEHMGFRRKMKEGEITILDKPKLIDNIPKYDGIKNLKYCILSSDDQEIMGNSSINKLINFINSPKNINGSEIKVILMTPVAGEGLSFYNIREMHLLEPWYHYNRVDQVIGRGIRNCSHQKLPLEDKNVTIFMHASVNGINNETQDIHAFRIASRKLYQTEIIDKIIRDNSIDCLLMKNINYFPKSLFELGKIEIITSQNKKIEYELGDDKELEPICNIIDDKRKDFRGFRKETYKHLIPNVQIRLRNLILEKIQNGERFIDIDYILDNIDINKDIIYETINKSIYPNVLIDGYTIFPHQEGLHIINISYDNPKKVRIIMNNENIKKDEKINIENTANTTMIKRINRLNKDDDISSTISFYNSIIDSETWEIFAKRIIEMNELDDTSGYLAKLLYKQGAFILNKELKSFKTQKSKFVGYINIFNINKLEGMIYVNNKYRDLTENELEELYSVRKELVIPNMSKEKMEWGMFIPKLDKKTNKRTNEFKILRSGESVGKRTGIVCTSISLGEYPKILEKIGIKDKYKTKIDNCMIIAKELLKINRLTLFPLYKPTILY